MGFRSSGTERYEQTYLLFQANSALEGGNCFHTTWKLSHKTLHRTLPWIVSNTQKRKQRMSGHTVRHNSAASYDSAPPAASSKRLNCLDTGQHRCRQPASLDPCSCSAERLEPHQAFRAVLWNSYEQARALCWPVLPAPLVCIGMWVRGHIPSPTTACREADSQ